MDSHLIDVDTTGQECIDLTFEVSSFCSGRDDGLCNVFVPHATAGLAIMELHAGSDVDLKEALGRLLPRDGRWVHSHGSPGHGADHVLPAFISPSLVIPVLEGRLTLGTWQYVVLVDTNRDNPQRQVRLSFLTS